MTTGIYALSSKHTRFWGILASMHLCHLLLWNNGRGFDDETFLFQFCFSNILGGWLELMMIMVVKGLEEDGFRWDEWDDDDDDDDGDDDDKNDLLKNNRKYFELKWNYLKCIGLKLSGWFE